MNLYEQEAARMAELILDKYRPPEGRFLDTLRRMDEEIELGRTARAKLKDMEKCLRCGGEGKHQIQVGRLTLWVCGPKCEELFRGGSKNEPRIAGRKDRKKCSKNEKV